MALSADAQLSSPAALPPPPPSTSSEAPPQPALQPQQRQAVPDAVIDAASGVVGGIVALVATYPLKTIYSYQAQDSKALSVLQVIQRYKLSGLFIGIQPNIFETALTSATYFYLYRKLKDAATGNGSRDLSFVASLLVPALAGVGNQLITMPASVVATRMQAMKKLRVDQRLATRATNTTSSSSHPPHPHQHASPQAPVTVGSVIGTVLREQGLGGFWAGLLPSLVLISNPTIQYMLYEQLLRALRAWKRRRLQAQWQQQQEQQEQQQQGQGQGLGSDLQGEGGKLEGQVVNGHHAPGSAVNGKHHQQQGQQQQQQGQVAPPQFDVQCAAWETFLVSALAKIGATVATYGLIVIKTRMQAQGKETPPELRYKSAFDALVRILRSEGLGGFTKGLGAKVVQTALNAALMLMLKEQVYKATRHVLTTPGLLQKAQHAITMKAL